MWRGYKVWESVNKPGRPTKILSEICHTLEKSKAIVCASIPKRKSEAIATQFLPVMAITELPL